MLTNFVFYYHCVKVYETTNFAISYDYYITHLVNPNKLELKP